MSSLSSCNSGVFSMLTCNCVFSACLICSLATLLICVKGSKKMNLSQTRRQKIESKPFNSKEMKEEEYANSLAKTRSCLSGLLCDRYSDELCYPTLWSFAIVWRHHVVVPLHEEHIYSDRKITETPVIDSEFCREASS